MTKVIGQHILAQAPTGSSAPDSITIGGGSIWVEYGNGADSTGKSGDTTIVEYSMLGQVEHTYTITGLADGLKYDPVTGNVWALLNNDGNATLRFINPTTGEVSGTLKYGSGYVYGPTSSRGFDDVVFDGSRVFMSETNPVNPGDPVIVQLLNGQAPIGTLETQGILSLGDTGTNLVTGQTNQTLPMTDPDSLKLLPNGDLLLTGEADGAYIFVKDPGTTQQTESFVQMPAGFVGDDAIMPSATAGTFYISNQGGNDIIRVSVTGLNTNDLYANIASKNELVQINPTTGKITPIVTGLSNPHGLAFVPATAPTVTTPVTPSHPATPPTSPSSTPSTPTPIVEGQHILAQAPTGSSAPDSITIGGGSIWVEYGNGADSTGKSGDTTIVEYSMLGQVEHTDTITGLADGLKYDPVTGNVWALLNNDGNATLRFINPTTGEVSSTLKYGSGYVYGPTSSRGFDDVVFDGSRVFMSETNPANPGDPVIVQLMNGEAPVGTLETQGILSLGDTGTNLVTGQTNQTLPMTDPDSLKLLSNGDLLLTGEADGAYIFVKDPGTTQQTESFVQMPAGFVGDDAIMPNATAGTFYISNQGGNDIVRVSVTGLNTNDLYADIASKNELVQIDPTTGKITPIVTGLSNPHGLAFVAAAASNTATTALANFAPPSGLGLLSTPAQGAHSADTASIHSATGVSGSAGAFDPMPSTVTSSAHHVDTLHHA
jgi:glutamine cyclotransferase